MSETQIWPIDLVYITSVKGRTMSLRGISVCHFSNNTVS